MATVSTQNITTAGLVATYAAVNSTDRFLPADGTFLHVKNGSGSSINVTLTTPQTIDGNAVADRVIAVAAGAEKFISLPDAIYRSSDGLGDVAYSSTTTVTAAVVRI